MNSLSNQLNVMKQSQYQLRHSLSFLKKFENLIRLPQEIKKAYVKKDYEKIVSCYTQNKKYLVRFKSLSVFSVLFQEIENQLKLTHDALLNEIKNEIFDFSRIFTLVSLILDLPAEEVRSEALERY